MKNCPYCFEKINIKAIKCRYCGEFLTKKSPINKKAKWNPGVSAVLSLIIPGAGQIYKGKTTKGLLWLIVVAIGYSLMIFPGIILHIICIFSASMGNPYKKD